MENIKTYLLIAGASIVLFPLVKSLVSGLGPLFVKYRKAFIKPLVYTLGGGALLAASFLPSDFLTPPRPEPVPETPVDCAPAFYAGVMYRLSEERPVGVWEYISMRDKILVNVREQYDYRFMPAEEFWVEMLKYIQTNWENLKSEDVSNHLRMLSIQFYQKGSGNAEMDAAWDEGYGAANAALEGNIPNPPTPEPKPTPDGDTCPDCNGSGKTGDGITDCLNCNGDGRIDDEDVSSPRKAVVFYLPNNSMNRAYVSRLKRDLENVTVGEDGSCDVVTLNYYDYKDIAKELGFKRFPSVVLLEGDTIVRKWTGTGEPLSTISDFLGG